MQATKQEHLSKKEKMSIKWQSQIELLLITGGK
jgi:hypothetical protein